MDATGMAVKPARGRDRQYSYLGVTEGYVGCYLGVAWVTYRVTWCGGGYVGVNMVWRALHRVFVYLVWRGLGRVSSRCDGGYVMCELGVAVVIRRV